MHQLAYWLRGLAASWGGPGLFVIAFLDSSFLSLPEINDILIVWMVTQRKELMAYYATLATLGSVVGCWVIYGLARKGGEALLQRRFRGPSLARAMAMYQRHGILTLMVPALLPPPAPFKLFVLLAGVTAVRPLHFLLAIAVARGLRYYLLGLLAIYYGDYTLDLLRRYGTGIGLWLAGALVIGAAIYVFLKKSRGRERL